MNHSAAFRHTDRQAGSPGAPPWPVSRLGQWRRASKPDPSRVCSAMREEAIGDALAPTDTA